MTMPGYRKYVCYLVLVMLFLVFSSTNIIAQNATNVKNATVDDGTESVRYMFVQTAQSGSFVPVAGNESLFNLTLEGVSPQTIAFSDQPERVVGQVLMQQFIDNFFRSKECIPNAAIEVVGADEDHDVVVAELLNPNYDAANQTLKYTMKVLEQANHTYAEFNNRSDKTLMPTFGPAALFIDDCWDCWVVCGDSSGYQCGNDGFMTGQCWCWKAPLECVTCKDRSTLSQMCAAKFGSKCGIAYFDNCGYSDNCNTGLGKPPQEKPIKTTEGPNKATK